MDNAELDAVLAEASKHDADYLYYLLGTNVESGFSPQSGKRAKEAGRTFFERFQNELRHSVCKKDGPYEQLIKGLASKKDLPKLVALAILSGASTLGGVAVTTVMAAYMALLIINSGLAAYCDGGRANGKS
jgi:hypothetical protein